MPLARDVLAATVEQPAPAEPVVATSAARATPAQTGATQQQPSPTAPQSQASPAPARAEVPARDTATESDETSPPLEASGIRQTVGISGSAVEPTPAPEPSLASDEEARMRAAIGDAQIRMSRAGVSFRVQASAAAEQALRQANALLAQAKAAPPDAAELAAAQQALDEAQAKLQQARDAQARASETSPQATLEAAQARLDALGAPADPLAVQAAQERLATAQQQLEQVGTAASAAKTAAESRMQATVALVTQLRQAYNASVLQYQTALAGIDPQTGQGFADGEATARQEQYAAAIAEHEQPLLAAEAQLQADYTAFEAARQQEIADVAAAQAQLDHAATELAQLNAGATGEQLAQAQAEVAAAQLALAEAQASSTGAGSAVARAQAEVDSATAKLEQLRQGGNAAAVAAARQAVAEAEHKLRLARQAGVDGSGWAWPTYGTITSGFGPRELLGGRSHNGVDIAAERGTPIAAARDGTVREAGWCAGYGYCVKLVHGDGMSSEYGHLDSQPVVEVGQTVTAGTIIGRMGTTYDAAHGGYSTGVHLHFTIRHNGVAVDPLRYLP